jgi:hypothetical protein
LKYKGSCHHGRVAFEVEVQIKGALACNCSICRRKGSLLWAVPREKLRLLTPEDAASTYTFNKHAINLCCLEGADLSAIPVQNYDGRSL